MGPTRSGPVVRFERTIWRAVAPLSGKRRRGQGAAEKFESLYVASPSMSGGPWRAGIHLGHDLQRLKRVRVADEGSPLEASCWRRQRTTLTLTRRSLFRAAIHGMDSGFGAEWSPRRPLFNERVSPLV